MKVYYAPIRQAGQPAAASDVPYNDVHARGQAASAKFAAIADKYPSTNPGKLARYYQAVTLLDVEKQNQALEELKKVVGGSDKELSAMAQYQMATIYARTGKTEDAGRTDPPHADQEPVLVPRPPAFLTL